MKYDIRIADRYGQRIEILQQLPSKGDLFPTVVLVPGFGVDLHEFGLFDDVSKILVNSGIQTFRFNFAGLGRSDGSYEKTTLFQQVERLQDVLDYIKKDRFTEKRRIGILAHGFGAVVTVSTCPRDVKTLILSDIMLDPGESLAKWFKRERGFEPKGISKRNRADKTQIKVGSEFWKSVSQPGLLEKGQQLKQSVLLIHGSKNTISKAFDSQELFEKIKNRKKFVIVSGARQSYAQAARPVFLKLVGDWFAETLL